MASSLNGSHLGGLLAFALAFLLRGIPLIAGFPQPTGYDIVAYYAPVLKNYNPFIDDWRTLLTRPDYSPLLYLLLFPFAKIMDIFVLLQLTAMLLFGTLSLSLYTFARRRLGWSPAKSLLASAIFAMWPAGMRIGWDLLKNMLALALVLIVLLYFTKEHAAKNSRLIAVLALLAVLTHQVALLIILIGIATAILWAYQHRARLGVSLIFALLPAAIAFGVVTFAGSTLPYAFSANSGVKVILVGTGSQGVASSPFINYYALYDNKYASILTDVLGFAAFLYAPLLPLIILGFVRNRAVSAVTALLMLASFDIVIWPSIALGLWFRWLLILIVPFSLYAANGLSRLLSLRRMSKLRLGILIILLAILAIQAVSYAVRTPEDPLIPRSQFLSYLPTSLLQNTVPLQDSADVVKVLTDLNFFLDNDSVLLVHESFFGWASLTVTARTTLINYHLGHPTDAIPLAKQLEFKQIYWVWWVTGKEWHNYKAPTSIFRPVMQSGNIAAYVYQGP